MKPFVTAPPEAPEVRARTERELAGQMQFPDRSSR